MMGDETILVACRSVPVNLVGSTLVVPWGNVRRVDGDSFLVDDVSIRLVRDEFLANQLDLPVDYEHHTLGGEYASPDGKACAAGWIKDVNGEEGTGIVARIEWGEEAEDEIRKKKYRYLSPTVQVAKKTGRVVSLHSAALTNKPAIVGFPALVNKAGKEKSMNDLMQKLRQALGAGDDATPEQLLAGVSDAVKIVASSRAIAGAIEESLEPLGGKDLAEAVRKGDVEAASKAVEIVVNRASNPTGMVPASDLAKANDRIAALERAGLDRECDELLKANSEKVPPAKVEWFKGFFARDPEYARKWIADAPELLSNRQTAAAETAVPDRAIVINKARAAYKEGHTGVTTEEAVVNDALRTSGMTRLTPDEVRTLGIAA